MAFEKKPNDGAIFRNKRKTSDTHPNMTGDALIECPHCKCHGAFFVDAYTKEPKTEGGERFQKLRFKPKDKQPEQPAGAGKTTQQRPPARPPEPDPADDGAGEDIPF